MAKLIKLGDAFQNDLLDPSVFKDGRFYIVDSVDAEGRIKLKTIAPLPNGVQSHYFDFSRLSNGDITWWGSRVRWLINDEKGNEKCKKGILVIMLQMEAMESSI
ncbi:hypothetical protein [Parashewanella curva]|uniref:hypothetical protein n=1 Tax=Parashewanella curva TaxID=2338552 RepID=UPI00105A985D|nr:hypothetical protein [Parashewanella curva]